MLWGTCESYNFLCFQPPPTHDKQNIFLMNLFQSSTTLLHLLFFYILQKKVHTKLWKILLSHLECFFGSCDLEISVIFFILVYFKICRGNWKWNMLRNGLHKLFKKARCRLGSEAIMKLFRTFWVFLKIVI